MDDSKQVRPRQSSTSLLDHNKENSSVSSPPRPVSRLSKISSYAASTLIRPSKKQPSIPDIDSVVVADEVSFRHPSFDFEQEARDLALKQEEEKLKVPHLEKITITPYVFNPDVIPQDLERTFRLGLSPQENELVITRTLNEKLVLFHVETQKEDVKIFDELVQFKNSNPSVSIADVMTQFCAHNSMADAYVKLVYEEASTHFDAVLKFSLTPANFSTDIQREVKQIGDEGLTTAFEARKYNLEFLARRHVARSRFLIEILEQRLAVQIERDMRGLMPESEDNISVGSFFVKLLAPFEVLAQTAERIGLHIETKKDRASRFKGRIVKGIAEIKREEEKLATSPPIDSIEPVNLQSSSTTITATETTTTPTGAVTTTTTTTTVTPATTPATDPEASKIRHRAPKERRISHTISRFTSETLSFAKSKIKPYKEGPDGTLFGNFSYMFSLINGFLEFDSKPFSRKHLAEFLHGDDTQNSVAHTQIHIFSSSRRNMLTHFVLQKLRVDNYSPVKNLAGVHDLLEDKVFTSFFALHDGPEAFGSTTDVTSLGTANNRPFLYREWTFRPVSFKKIMGYQPLREIRDYFGEKVAFYFAWVGFYALWCQLLTIVGVLVVIYGIVAASQLSDKPLTVRIFRVFDNELTIVFALLVSVWATLFLEFWKRQTKILQYVWDLRDLKGEETQRPQWTGSHKRTSEVTGHLEPYVPLSEQLMARLFTGIALTVSIFVIVVFQGLIVIYNNWSKTIEQSVLSVLGTAFFALINILLLTPVYVRIATTLNNLENYKSQLKYRDALNLKLFILTFINSFASLFYLGIIKAIMSQPDVHLGVWNPGNGTFVVPKCGFTSEINTCLSEVTVQMGIMFLVLQFLYQITEILIPVLTGAYHKVVGKKKKEDMEPQYIQDDLLNHYDVEADFKSKVLQFGYINLFSVAFPLAPLFALINNLTEIRIDALKLVRFYQRPFGYRVRDIGLWEDILKSVTWFGVLSNAFLIAFGSDSFSDFVNDKFKGSETVARLVFILIFEHAVFLISALVMQIIPDTPKKIINAIRRDNYLTALEKREIKDSYHRDDVMVVKRRYYIF